jgi:DNA-3-methyladenine glycosylase
MTATSLLPLSFFQRDAQTVARELIGKTLVVRKGRKIRRCRIVETEAYVGPHDLASHASKGRTARTEVMFAAGGRTYVYFIYGMYHMLNIVTGHEGDAQAVLVRAAEPLDGWTTDLSGPGKLARELGLTSRDNALLLNGERIGIYDAAGPRLTIHTSPRIGVDYAGDWKHAPLRFFDAHSSAVSGPKRNASDSKR